MSDHWSNQVSSTIGVVLDAIERVAQTDSPDKAQLGALADTVTKLTEAEQGHRLLEAKLAGHRTQDE